MPDKSTYVVSKTVISEPDSAITVTVLELSPEAQSGLSTRGATIPSPADCSHDQKQDR